MEENKTFDLIIIPRSLSSDIGLDSANRTKIVIVDDDSKSLVYQYNLYIYLVYSYEIQNVTVFWKTDHLCRRTEFHLLPVYDRHTHTLYIKH